MKKKILMVPFCFIVLAFGFYVFNFHYGLSTKNDVWGQFGDWFGGILNPILAALAFIGMMWAYDAQIKANELASGQFKKQNTDDRLFRMIDLHLAKVDSMKIYESAGRAAIEVFLNALKDRYKNSLIEVEKVKFKEGALNPEYSNFQLKIYNTYVDRIYHNSYGAIPVSSIEEYNQVLTNIKESMRDQFVDEVFANTNGIGLHEELVLVSERAMSDVDIGFLFKTVYDEAYTMFGNEIGHYFRNMAQILKAINNESREARLYYGKLFRAQFSRYEIALIANNCISSMTDSEFNYFVNRYDLLKGLFPKDLTMQDRFYSVFSLRNKELNVDETIGSAYTSD